MNNFFLFRYTCEKYGISIEPGSTLHTMLKYLPEEAYTQPHSLGDSYYSCTQGYCLFCSDVLEDLMKISQDIGIKWDRPESPAIIALMIDWYKIRKFVNVQEFNPELGEVTSFWVHNPFHRTKGNHAEWAITDRAYWLKVSLTEQERLCILYHHPINKKYMPKDITEYSKVLNSHPEVLAVQAVVAMALNRRVEHE